MRIDRRIRMLRGLGFLLGRLPDDSELTGGAERRSTGRPARSGPASHSFPHHSPCRKNPEWQNPVSQNSVPKAQCQKLVPGNPVPKNQIGALPPQRSLCVVQFELRDIAPGGGAAALDRDPVGRVSHLVNKMSLSTEV